MTWPAGAAGKRPVAPVLGYVCKEMETTPAAEFDLLLRGHVRPLYRYAYRWTGDPDHAEDLVQETLTRLFTELDQLRQIERIRPWATRVMYRLFIDGLRRMRRSPVTYVGRSGSTGAMRLATSTDSTLGPKSRTMPTIINGRMIPSVAVQIDIARCRRAAEKSAKSMSRNSSI